MQGMTNPAITMITRKLHLASAFTLAALLSGLEAQTPEPAPLGKPGTPHTFTIGDADFLLGGQRLQIRCGEIHAARVPREYWPHRLKMCKAMGLNTVCAYLFWNMHEPREGSSTGVARRMSRSSAGSRRRKACG